MQVVFDWQFILVTIFYLKLFSDNSFTLINIVKTNIAARLSPAFVLPLSIKQHSSFLLKWYLSLLPMQNKGKNCTTKCEGVFLFFFQYKVAPLSSY